MFHGDTGLRKFTSLNVLCEEYRVRKFTLLNALNGGRRVEQVYVTLWVVWVIQGWEVNVTQCVAWGRRVEQVYVMYGLCGNTGSGSLR